MSGFDFTSDESERYLAACKSDGDDVVVISVGATLSSHSDAQAEIEMPADKAVEFANWILSQCAASPGSAKENK